MFLVFAGQTVFDYTRSGGWNDLIEEFYEEEKAISFAVKLKSQFDWVQVVDFDVKKVIWEHNDMEV